MRLLPLAILLAGWAGCVDFVDPTGLRLARETSIELSFDLATDPVRATCSGPGSISPGDAVLCVGATLTPGVTHLGERLRVLDDTLRVMGTALTPSVGEDSVLRYQGRFALPNETLEDVAFTASFPLVEGMATRPADIRWFALGRAGPDTLVRQPGGGVRLRIDLPGGASTPPPPGAPFWRADVAGDTAVATYSGTGLPRSGYDFPAEVLAALGGSRFRGQLTWNRSLSYSAGGVRLLVRFHEWLGWTILTEEPGPDGADGADD